LNGDYLQERVRRVSGCCHSTVDGYCSKTAKVR
jgi:hypothetical protein